MRVTGAVLALAVGCGFTRLPPLDLQDAAAPGEPDAREVMIDAAVPPDAPPDAPPAVSCTATQLVAWRTHDLFPTFVDAELTDLAGKTLALPATLPVTRGNAANQCARMTFQTELIGTTQCIYKGGATVAHVGTDPAQIAAGMTYTLQHCKTGIAISFADCGGFDLGAELAMTAGTPVPYRSFVLRVEDGDDQLGPTEVTVIADVCDP